MAFPAKLTKNSFGLCQFLVFDEPVFGQCFYGYYTNFCCKVVQIPSKKSIALQMTKEECSLVNIADSLSCRLQNYMIGYEGTRHVSVVQYVSDIVALLVKVLIAWCAYLNNSPVAVHSCICLVMDSGNLVCRFK